MGILKKSPVLLILLSAFTTGAFAQPGDREYVPVEDLEKLVETLNDNSRTIESIKSSFIQKKQLEFLDETIISQGAFWFKKENSLRWVYTDPYEYAIVLHQGKFMIIDGTNVNEYDIESNEAFREINDLIIGMVQGRVLKQDKFAIEAFENASFYQVKLVPRDPEIGNFISRMELYFDMIDLTVSKIVMIEGELDYTEITFTDKQFNETIPDTVFSAHM